MDRRVVIVGAGLAGTATAIRLLQFAREPVDIMLIERRAEYRNAGVAYHRESNHWHHVFNIQAGRMSVFREDVDDFVNWANNEADRTGWPAEWRDFVFTESGPAPRRIYPDYLARRLAQAAAEALDGVTLTETDGEAVDLTVHGDLIEVVVDLPGSGRVRLTADQVVLATGLEQRDPGYATAVLDHPAFVRHPYSAAGMDQILTVRPDAVVAIVGTLLSAYDSANLLLRGGHTGTIHLISRSGLTLRAYPPEHRHRVLTLPPPRFGGDIDPNSPDFLRFVRAEWDNACTAVAREYPEEAPAVRTERVLKSWEPHLPDIIARIPSAELRALLDRYGSLVAVLRVGVMPYSADTVGAALGEQVVVTAGRVDEVRPGADGRLVVSIATTPAEAIEADLVIANFGRETDYERVDSRLWTNLLRKGIASAHRRTGRGVEVDGCGALTGSAGRISVVGSPREGDEIVRNGRMGAFTFNLAAIKNHSVQVAATTLCRLETCYGEPVAALPDALAEAVSQSAMLDVRRMTARRRDHRQALVVRVDERLREIHELAIRHGDTPPSDRALRTAVTTAAAGRLTDLSVTPRDLRSNLGLGRTPGTGEVA